MAMKSILTFIFLFKISYNVYVYQPETFFRLIKEEKVEENKLNEIITKLSEGFEDAYAFYSLSKNPPDTGYEDIQHNKVDIKKELGNINTKERDFYGFLQDFLKVFAKIKDDHTSIFLNGINEFTKLFYKVQMIFYFPVIFNIRNDTNGIPRMYANPNKNDTFNKQFRDSSDIYPIINSSNESAIKTINGLDPFDYIDKIASEFWDIRSPHGSFTLKFNVLHRIPVFLMPLYEENLTNFTIEYENNKTFSTDIFIISNETIFPKYSNITPVFGINNFDNLLKGFTFIPEIKELPYEIIKLNEYGVFDFKLDNSINSVSGSNISWKDWNYTTPDDNFKCRVDEENKLNVYFIRSFSPDAYNTINIFAKAIMDCAKLFDQNDYKTILINSLNGGGAVLLSELLLQMISPYTSFNIYSRMRVTESIKSNFRGIFYGLDKCKMSSQFDFVNNAQKINYSDVSDYITDPFILVVKSFRKESDELRKTFKNKRKPTDVMVFTDGYSFSATSMLCKYLQHYGGGIVVGYFGNPKLNTTFDSSLSPSAITTMNQLILWNEKFRDLWDKYQIYLQFAYYQSFFDPNDRDVPLEYVVTPVDERISLYENFNESNYHIFVQKAKEIFAKYENKCSTVNKNLVLFNPNCTFENKNIHGGNPCGDNGEWNLSACAPSYCDNNYIFDKKNEKCMIDDCTIVDENIAYIVFYGIFFTLTILIIIGMICFACVMYCRRRKISSSKAINNKTDEDPI